MATSICAVRSLWIRPSWWSSIWVTVALGWARANPWHSSGATMAASVVKQPTRTGPRTWLCALLATSYKAMAWSSRPRISRRTSAPAGVTDRPCAWWRTNSGTCSSASTWVMAEEMDEGETWMRLAASAMLPNSPAATQYSNCLKVSRVSTVCKRWRGEGGQGDLPRS